MMWDVERKEGLLAELRRSPMFCGCGPSVLQTIVESASLHAVRRGFQIAKSGAAFPFLGFVRNGVIGVTAVSRGPMRAVRRFTIYEAHGGSTFGEVAILDRSIAVGEISVLSKRAVYALIPDSRISAAALADAGLLARLGSVAAARCRDLASRLTSQRAWPVAARVARVLLSYAAEREGLQPTATMLGELTQRDIAAAAGCVPEAAARAIATLERAGAISREHGHIRYADRRRLLQYCDGI
jgi:CRP-like cAMP-binding protein